MIKLDFLRMNPFKLNFVLFLFSFNLISLCSFSLTIASKSTGITGNWNDINTWVGGAIPTTGDVVTIGGGDDITVDIVVNNIAILNLSGSAAGTSLTISAGNSLTTNRTNVFSDANGSIANITNDGTYSTSLFYGLPIHNSVTVNLGGTSSYSISSYAVFRGEAGGQATYNLTMTGGLTASTFMASNNGVGSSCLVNLKVPITCTNLWLDARNSVSGVTIDTRWPNSELIVNYRIRTSNLVGTMLSNNSQGKFTWNGAPSYFYCSSALSFPSSTINSDAILPADLIVAGDLTINASKNLVINSNTVSVGGTFFCSGKATITTGTISMNGSTTQGIGFSTVTTIPNLDISNTGGGVFIIGDTIKITKQVSFNAGFVTAFNTQNILVLKDFGSGMANLGNLNSHTITGNVTCEYKTQTLSNVGYRHLTSPVTGKTINDFMYNAGTCDSCFYGYGFTGANSPSTTIASTFTYDNAAVATDFDEGWTIATNITNAVSYQRGITWFMGPGVGSGNKSEYSIEVNGNVNSGSLAVNSFNSNMNFAGTGAEKNWALVGNPYPSTIDFSTVTLNNVDTDPYLFKADNGGYGIDKIIPPFQAFFVKMNGVGATLTFNESDKTTTQKVFQKNIKENDELIVKLTPNQYPTKFNYTYINFKKGSTNNFDSGIDKEPLTNPWPYANVTCETDDDKSTYRYVTDPEQGHISIPINAIGYVSGNYELNFSNLSKINGCVILEDKFTGKMINLSIRDSSYSFFLNDTTSISRFNLHVYNFSKEIKVTNSSCFNSNSGSVNLQLYNHDSYITTLFDSDLNTIENGVVSDQKTINNLNPGNYSIEIESVSLGCPEIIEYFTIHEPGEIKTAFNISNELLSFKTNNEIEFNNLSSGQVASYLWEFGDNSTTNEVNPKHSYALSGTYDVTLTSANLNPECDVSFKQAIEISEATGLDEILNSASYIIFNDHGSYFVQFKKPSQSDFIYELYDIQGRKISNGFIGKGAVTEALEIEGNGVFIINMNYNNQTETVKVLH